MNTQHIPIVAGAISTSIFTLSQLPMLSKAYRTKDLRSYSAAHLLLANCGNALHWLYVVDLPSGPIWFLHSFHTIAAALMLFLYLRYHRWHTTTQAKP